jgi:hypothetical protein
MSFDLRHLRALVQNEDKTAFGRFQNSGISEDHQDNISEMK